MSTKPMYTGTTIRPVTRWPLSDDVILASAAIIIAERYVKKDAYTNPQPTKDFLTYKLGGYEREVFAVNCSIISINYSNLKSCSLAL